jgi:hypothetical protein
MATPNSATNNPLAAISSSPPIASQGDRVEAFQVAIKRKTPLIAMISHVSTPAFHDLLHECRTASLGSLGVLAGRPVKPKNHFADNTFREGLP